MKIWGLLPVVSAPMPFQMALDEVLFRRFEASDHPAPILRFYFSSEPWVTDGYFSKAEPSPGSCRRLTGGGRVQHGQDLIFSLIAGKKDDPSFASVTEGYHRIHQAVKTALEASGLSVRFYSENHAENMLNRGPECFVYPIESDLEVGGKKIAGGAQKRSSGVLLHQESIEIREGLDAFSLIASLRKAFESVFEIKVQDGSLDSEVWSLAKRYSRGGYVPGRYRVSSPSLEKVH